MSENLVYISSNISQLSSGKGRMGANEFIPATKGSCFLCLSDNGRVKSDLDGLHPSQTQCTNYCSLECLVKFLNMDISNILNDNCKPSLSAFKGLPRSEKIRLKTELCEECLHYVESFSISYKKLKKVEMEVMSLLQSLHEKLKQVKREGGGQIKTFEGVGTIVDIVDLLRTELLIKCSTKLKANFPRISLQRLTWDQVDNEHISKADSNSNTFVKSEPYTLVASEDDQDNPICSDSDMDDQGAHMAFEIEPANSLDIKPILSDQSMPHSMTTTDSPKQQNSRPTKLKRKYLKGPCKCSYCQRIFKTAGLLASHKRKVHFGRGATASVQCNNCASYFLTEGGYNYHVNKQVCQKRWKLNVLANQGAGDCKTSGSDNLSKQAPTNKYACSICSTQFKSLPWLTNHMKKIHNVYPKKWARDKGKAKGKQNEMTQHQCAHCLASFSSVKQLESHRHHKCPNNKRYICELCKEGFRTPYELRRHRRKIHNAERLKCQYCPGTFLLQTYLNRHTRECHGDVVQRPVQIYNDDDQLDKSNDDEDAAGCKKSSHQCEHCDKRYDTEKGLNHHLKLTHLSKFIHRFECNICLKNFKRVTHLKRHQTSVHQKLRYLCELCSGTFYDYDYMRLHMRTTCPNKVE